MNTNGTMRTKWSRETGS